MFQWAYAKKYAELHNLELRTNPWPGQRIFEGVNEGPLVEGGEALPENYRQTQADLIYTRSDCLRWFKWRSGVGDKLGWLTSKYAAHHRVGDYTGLGYCVIPLQAYFETMPQDTSLVTDAAPCIHPDWHDDLTFVPDFYRLCMAEVMLFRGNSSFSWWAATLNRTAAVFAPIIDDERQFRGWVHGNWPRLNPLPCNTNLHLQP